MIARTEWFGTPKLLPERLSMIGRFHKELSPQLAKQIDRKRLDNAERLLREAPLRMTGRVWEWSIRRTPFCVDRFPLALDLYEYLAHLPSEDYIDRVRVTRIDSTLALHAAVQCFRKLITIDNGERRALPFVTAGPFHATKLSKMATKLIGYVSDEISSRDGSSPEDVCVEARPDDSLCDAYKYLAELQPLIVD